MKFEFIERHRSLYDVVEMCETLGVSTSGYYRRESSGPSLRQSEDESFKEKILEVHGQAVGDYGHRPVHRHLLEDGVDCGRDRTLRLMNELQISGRQSKGYRPQGTDSAHDFGYSPNLLKGLGETSRCDEAWVADTTYLQVQSQWMYVATVMDRHSRRILGWSVSPSNDTALILEALNAAASARGTDFAGVIHHSDRGSTYASYAYRNRLFALGMRSSMSAKGNCYDNAAMESFYGRFKTGSVRERIFSSEAELRRHVFLYIEMFYNRFRKHSSLGYRSPTQFERDFFAPHGGRREERYLYQDQGN